MFTAVTRLPYAQYDRYNQRSVLVQSVLIIMMLGCFIVKPVAAQRKNDNPQTPQITTPVVVTMFKEPEAQIDAPTGQGSTVDWAAILRRQWKDNWGPALLTAINRELGNKKIPLLEREQSAAIERELGLIGSTVDASKAAEIGAKFGAKLMLLGNAHAESSQSLQGRIYKIDLEARFVDVSTGRMVKQYTANGRRVRGILGGDSETKMTLKTLNAAAEDLAKKILNDFPQESGGQNGPMPGTGQEQQALQAIFQTVTVEGQATINGNDMAAAHNLARAAAMRRAIEQVAGVYVSSTTQAKDFEVVKDEIYTRSDGFASVVGEPTPVSTDNGILREQYTIRVLLSSGEAGKAAMLDVLRQHGLLRQLTVMVYIPETHIARRIPDPAVETAILHSLVEAGFKVVDKSQVEKLQNDQSMQEITRGVISKLQLQQLQAGYGADVLVTGEAFSERAENDRGGNASVRCASRGEVKAYVLTTAEIVYAGSVPQSQAQGVTEAIAAKAALQKAGEMIAPQLVNALVKNAIPLVNRAGGAGSPTKTLNLEISGWGKLSETSQFLHAVEKFPGVHKAVRQDFRGGVLFADVEVDRERADDIADLLESAPAVKEFDIAVENAGKTGKITGAAHKNSSHKK